ncbi:hypothetical protein V8G54_030695 [Vigna mungo]|uniref:Uncharacterized protein n=1 Tax=Vigna mungo TaxID=3915 RepID=A0AAQ3MVL0_VIGMU
MMSSSLPLAPPSTAVEISQLLKAKGVLTTQLEYIKFSHMQCAQKEKDSVTCYLDEEAHARLDSSDDEGSIEDVTEDTIKVRVGNHNFSGSHKHGQSSPCPKSLSPIRSTQFPDYVLRKIITAIC